MTRRDRIFLDASVLLAAAGSPSGGSFAALKVVLGSEGRHQAVTSSHVEREARRNLRLKFTHVAVIRFDALLGELMPIHVDLDAAPEPLDLPDFAAAKDHHVIAACLASNASICLTLDRRHLLTEEIRQWGHHRGLRFLTPGEFILWHRGQQEGGG